MNDIIQLLPDSIANQIAAGEVVQRPASVVKELLENAIDAGADDIQLILKDGGQNLIQVIDNGKGMGEIDARMCWERHATSKIAEASDLFKIKTFGFRGEALASIAAIAQVHLYTRQEDQDIGTHILIEASEIISQEPSPCKKGTNIEVRNLFFNVPARRNFLKSVSVETRHIIDEFQRVALANPQVSFSMFNDKNEVFQLHKAGLKQRISDILGKKKADGILAVHEETDLIQISGYIGSPELAKKTRGEQFLYVNGRFIKHPYFNHAITGAYEGLIETDHYPLYILFLEVDPASIDINVHPTKTEVKFEDGSSIYKILRSVVQKEIASAGNSPQIDLAPDFGNAPEYNPHVSPIHKAPEPSYKKDYNPFQESKGGQPKENLSRWEKLYEPLKHEKNQDELPLQKEIKPILEVPVIAEEELSDIFQLHQSFIACLFQNEFYLINQQAAHERVLFERFMQAGEHAAFPSQQLLFPRTIAFSASDFELVKSLMDEINSLGFDISIFGKNTIIVNGTPADTHKAEAEGMIEGLLENYKSNLQTLKIKKRENIARAMAVHSSIKRGQKMQKKEMSQLVYDLFHCQHPAFTPGGKPIFVNFNEAKLMDIFKLKG